MRKVISNLRGGQVVGEIEFSDDDEEMSSTTISDYLTQQQLVRGMAQFDTFAARNDEGKEVSVNAPDTTTVGDLFNILFDDETEGLQEQHVNLEVSVPHIGA